MIDSNDVQQMFGRDVVGSDDKKIGKAGQVFLDDETGSPEWVTVNTGLFGTNESFVPLQEATLTGDGVVVPYTKDTVKDAPNVDPDAGHLTPEEESELYRYYGITPSGGGRRDDEVVYDQDQDQDRTAAAGRTADVASDGTMTRSEEQLKVGTQTREAGRARLRKYVVTEEQTVNVPVTHEEVRLEREPITNADAVTDVEIGEEVAEVTLHEEQVVVEKEAVAVEKVKLGKETVTEQQTVTEQVRKEQIETDLDGDGKPDTRR